MNSTIHERPGVYSSYDASSILSGEQAGKTVGVAAIAAEGNADEVVLLHSYAEGVEAFGEDAAGTHGMAAILKLLFANGAGAVKAVVVAVEDDEADYESAFALLGEEEDVEIVVCDSADEEVHAALRDAVTEASGLRRERIAVAGGSGESAAQMVAHAQSINSERGACGTGCDAGRRRGSERGVCRGCGGGCDRRKRRRVRAD